MKIPAIAALSQCVAKIDHASRSATAIRFAFGGVLLVATVAALSLPLWAPQFQVVVDPQSIAREQGSAYGAPLSFPVRYPLYVASDRGDAGDSNLVLRENGRTLGPPHTLHAEIRTSGQGRYSHWGDYLYFSASDSSDPRTNARRYVAVAEAKLSTSVFVGLMFVNLVFVFLLRRRILAALLVRRRTVIGALVSGAIAAAVAMVSLPSWGEPKDLNLIVAAVLHVGLAIVLVTAQWIVGAGVARALLPKERSTYAEILLLGFPLSLGLAAILIATALTVPYGGWLALLLMVACVWPLYKWPVEAASCRELMRRLPAFLISGGAFGMWLALEWHGPTATLDGHPSGDLIYYASGISSIWINPLAPPNLGNEGEFFIQFNKMMPALGAALRPLVEVDGFLFVLTTSGVAAVVGTCIALHAYLASKPPLRIFSGEGLVLLLSVLVAGRYPFWIAESPSVAVMVPLTISVWFWSVWGRPRAAAVGIATAAAVIGSALSKVVTLATLGSLALISLTQVLGRRSVPALMVVAALALIVGGYAALMLAVYVPYFAQISVVPESYEHFLIQGNIFAVWPYLARDIGCVALAGIALFIVPWPYAAAVAFGFLIAAAFPFVMRANFACAAVLLALAIVDARRYDGRWLVASFAGQLLLLPAMLMTDPGGNVTGLVWLLAMGGAVLVALPKTNVAPVAGEREVGGAIVLVGSVVLALLIVGAARGILSLPNRHGVDTLTPDLRDIWRKVRGTTPPDALIFTDLTGPEPTTLRGWNTYAFQGERQVYLSSWYQSWNLRNDSLLRDQRLETNRRVLEGQLRPVEVPTRQKYGSYYAVVTVGRAPPDGWSRIYQNTSYELWRFQ